MWNNVFDFFAWQPVHIWAVAAVFGLLFLAAILAKAHYPQLRSLPLFIAFVMWLAFGFGEREAVIHRANIRIDIVFGWPFFFAGTALLIGLFILSLIRAVRAAKERKITTLFTSLPIIVAGPIVTAFLLIGGKGDGKVSATLVIIVLILSAVPAVVSTVAHLIFKNLLLGTVVSVFISELLYVLLQLAYCFCTPKSAEAFMWLPIMLLFLIPYAFPTALSVSWGTGIIVLGFGEGKSDRKSHHSPDLAKSLIEDDDAQKRERANAIASPPTPSSKPLAP
jgi:hypothetical protein